MKSSIFSLLIVFLIYPLKSQNLPLVFSTGFNDTEDLSKFEFTDPDAWILSDSLGNKSLALVARSQYKTRVRSPFNIALISDIQVGTFVLEADLLQTGREYGHRDLCVFFAAKDPDNFYYVHMASKADPNAHNIFLVNDEDRRNIADTTSTGIDWGSDWNHIKIIRERESGLIQVYFNDMQNPIMEATDQHFDYGLVGFGSFDDTGKVDNVKIWGEIAPVRKGFFR